MTLEGCVMRIADVIAYIGRDIEDAINKRHDRKIGRIKACSAKIRTSLSKLRRGSGD